MYSHLINAKRTANKSGIKIRNLSPHFHMKLISAIRRGATITERIIVSRLTDEDAFARESKVIGNYHKRHAGQLWNTVDERFMDPKYLPVRWSNPVNPLYRLPRPLNERALRPAAGSGPAPAP
jgi:hypothetical protein